MVRDSDAVHTKHLASELLGSLVTLLLGLQQHERGERVRVHGEFSTWKNIYLPNPPLGRSRTICKSGTALPWNN